MQPSIFLFWMGIPVRPKRVDLPSYVMGLHASMEWHAREHAMASRRAIQESAACHRGPQRVGVTEQYSYTNRTREKLATAVPWSQKPSWEIKSNSVPNAKSNSTQESGNRCRVHPLLSEQHIITLPRRATAGEAYRNSEVMDTSCSRDDASQD